jgi:L-methionine (R)-S-oxide reductase
MAEELTIDVLASKADKYKALLPQLEGLLSSENDSIANLANTTAALKQTFNFFWVGFYLVKDESLVLGPFQGPIACTRIAKGKGVCGSSWEQRKTIVVPDVNAFPGHIACSSASLSEIVVPAFNTQGDVIMVLDVDSDRLNDFDDIDEHYLNNVIRLIEKKFQHV